LKGYIQVYTGNGKGKTTAALGLAVRAVGAGLKVYIAQFLKGMDYAELHSLKKFSNITLERFGRPQFIHGKPDKEDIRLAQEGLKRIREVLSSGNYDVVILDEANIAVHLKLFSAEELIEAIRGRASNEKGNRILGGNSCEENPEFAFCVHLSLPFCCYV